MQASPPSTVGMKRKLWVHTPTSDWYLLHARIMLLCLDCYTHLYFQKGSKKSCESPHKHSCANGQLSWLWSGDTIHGFHCPEWSWTLNQIYRALCPYNPHPPRNTHTHQPTEPQHMILYPLERSALSAGVTYKNESGEREDKVQRYTAQ